MKNQVKLKRMTESKKLRNVLTGEKKANEKKKFKLTYFFFTSWIDTHLFNTPLPSIYDNGSGRGSYES